MSPIEAEIRAMIALDGPIPVSRFMAICLGHPLHGYYMVRDPLGAGGDFTTAPEISQMFGELIGLWAAALWRQMGEPPRFNLVELGPGRGTLMADALRAAAVLPGLRSAMSVHLVETSPVLRDKQRSALEGAGVPLQWHRGLAEVPELPIIAIANEFYDALPISQAVRGPKGWHERMVGMAEDRLLFALHPEPLGQIDAVIPQALRDAPEGALFEWRAEHLTTELGRRVVESGGAALIVDYGHAESALGDTFQAVHGHQFADPLQTPGKVDLTAHVDFAALRRQAESTGARVHGPVQQGEFLRRLGIKTRAKRLKEAASPEQRADIDAALKRLTGGGKGMGELFKALAIADPKLGALPAFDTQD